MSKLEQKIQQTYEVFDDEKVKTLNFLQELKLVLLGAESSWQKTEFFLAGVGVFSTGAGVNPLEFTQSLHIVYTQFTQSLHSSK